MMIIPIAVLVIVVTVMVGGPGELVKMLEGYLRVFVDWVAQIT